MNDQSAYRTDSLLPDKIRVLHIDDEEDFLYLTKEFIEKMSEGEIEVESLRDSSKVIDRLKSNEIDVVVCDYLMEDLNGLDLLKTIKQEELNIPFIIFTGRGREEVVIDALNLGANYYIRKGSDVRSQYAELVHQIRTVLRHKKAEEALVKGEKELKEERDRSQLYLNEASVMFVIVNSNEEVELMNKEVTRVLGYSENELLGENWFTTIYPSEITDEMRFNFQQIIVGMRKSIPYNEIETTTKTGEKRVIAWYTTDIVDEQGKVIKLLGVGEDITKRKEMEAALRDNEERYRSLVETSPYSIVLADMKGYVTYANHQAAEMHGVDSPEELVGSSMLDYTSPEDHPRLMERMRTKAFMTLKGAFEYSMIRKDGTIFPVELNVSVLKDASGRPTGLMTIARDLTEVKLTQHKIEESEARYRGFVQNFEGIAFRGSIGFKPFFFHGAVTEITGYSEADFVDGDLSWDDVVLPEDMEKLLAIREELESTPGYSNTMEYRIKRKDGQIRWIRQHIQNTTTDEDEGFIVQGSLIDISDEQTMQENLRESESKFKSLFEGIPDAIFIADVETKTIVDCNKQAEILLKRSREEILQLKAPDLHPEEYIEPTMQAFERHVQGSKELVRSIVLTRDSERVNVSINASIITISGRKYLQGSFRDITELRRQEELLNRSETRYKRLVDTSPDGIVMTDLGGTITFANTHAAKLYGVNLVEEIIGLSFSQSVEEKDRERASKAIEKIITDGAVYGEEYRLNRVDGTYYDAEVNISKIDDFAGNPVAFISVIRDISDRKLAEKKLRDSETLYRTIFENTGMASSIVSSDQIIKMVNSKFEELTGYSKEETENKLDWTKIVVKDDAASLLDYQHKFEQEPGTTPENFEIIIKDKSGNLKNTFISVKAIPDTDDFIVTIQDITKMKSDELKLKESANLYRTLFESTGTMIAIANYDTKIELMNDQLARFSGYSREEVEGKMSWTKFVAESELERLLEFNKKRLKDPSSVPERYETNLVDKQGKQFRCLLHVGIIPETEKYVIGMIDITEAKKAEEEYMRTANLYRTIFEATGTANIIMGPDRIIKQVNSKVEEVTGYKPEDLIGQNWSQFVSEETLGKLLKFSRTRTPQVEIIPEYIETEFISKLGETRYVLLSLISIPNSGDYVVSFFDVTEKKEAEEEVRKSEIRYRTIFSYTGMANIIFDVGSIILLVNTKMEELSGYKKEELEGRKWSDFIPEPELEMMVEYNRKRMADPSSVPDQYETRFKDKSGNIRNILIAVVSIPESTDFLATVVDISDRRKTLDTLAKQKQELSDFAHLMAHDIRNSLSSIEGYVDLILEGETESEQYLVRVNRQTEYMRSLLDRSIELAEAGLAAEKSDTVNLNELVKSMAQMTIDSNIQFKTEPLFSVKADREKLSQIIKNLLENAVIHGHPRSIEVKFVEKDDVNVLKIMNDGRLINKEIIEEAFDTAFTTKEKESIHGLAIVKRLIDAHGWQIILCEVTEKPCFDIIIPKKDIIEQ